MTLENALSRMVCVMTERNMALSRKYVADIKSRFTYTMRSWWYVRRQLTAKMATSSSAPAPSFCFEEEKGNSSQNTLDIGSVRGAPLDLPCFPPSPAAGGQHNPAPRPQPATHPRACPAAA
jgi:hypothetical protein